VQSTLEKVRTLSHALHPAALEEMGFESALDHYLPGFERQTGITIRYEKAGASRELDGSVAIHLYRVMQEALNQYCAPSKSTRAPSASAFCRRPSCWKWRMKVWDREPGQQGMGLVSMRERAEMVNGEWSFSIAMAVGRWSVLTVPMAPEEAHA